MSDIRAIPEKQFATTNLAARWRTIRGLLDEMDFRGMADDVILHILKQAGLPPAAMDDPDFPLSMQQDWQILHILLTEYSDKTHPVTRLFQHANRFELTVMGLMGLAMKHAPDFGTAARITMDYPQLTWGRCRLTILRQANETQLVYDLHRQDLANWNDADFTLLREHALAADLVGGFRIVDGVSRNQLRPARIEFTLDQPGDWHLAKDNLPCPVIFNAPGTRLVYQGDIASWPMPGYNKRAHRTFMNAVERAAATMVSDDGASGKVRRWLWACPVPPGRPEMARMLSMSERSLNRRLKEEGTSYRDLTKEVQAERAKNLLAEDNVSVAEIGWRLGYAEPQAFSLAFRNWTGQSPSAWRQQTRP